MAAVTKDRGRLKDEVLFRVQGDGALHFLQRLGHSPVRDGREWAIVCPYHDDHDPSLKINLPGQKSPGGIFWCHACGSGGDIFKFVQETRGLGGFRETLDFMASQLGLGGDGAKATQKPMQAFKEVISKGSSQSMNSVEVYAALKRIREAKLDPAQACAGLGVSPWAMEITGGFVAKVRKDRASGQVVGGQGCTCFVVPMRRPPGEMSSVRFAMVDKAPGERRRRWSLDEDAPGEERQAKHSNSALLCPAAYFENPPKPDVLSIVVEGETDLWAGIDMMRPYSEDPLEWPARWFGLPGVTNCIDMLIPELVGTWLCTFMDSDRAGRSAVFDRKPLICELCAKRVPNTEYCRQRREGGGECGGRAIIDIKSALIPGLLSRTRSVGISSMAAFPPEEADKVDLRNLRQREWDWERLKDHIMATATRNVRGAA